MTLFGPQIRVLNRPIRLLADIMKAPKKAITRGTEILKSLGATEVYLFGSAASGDFTRDSDLDFAVRGLPAENFYLAVGTLLDEVRHPIDLDDLSEDTPFSRRLISRGKLVRVG